MSPKPVSYKIERFTGMYHSPNGDTPSPDLLWFSENLVPVDGVLVTRPGFVTAGTIANSGQGLSIFVDGGTERLIGVAGGEVYSIDSLTGTTWTKRLSTAQLTAASITLDTSARVYMTQLGEYLHFTDGTNVPFRWDGTSGSGASSLTNSPVLYGAPTVYYGKLFGIKNTDRQMIVWSEENDLTTGYEAGGYTNRWALTQTGGGTLYALKGTNEALYYWRASNIGAINGEVGPNFTTTGVHDAVSLERGTLTTVAAVGYGGVWFHDESMRPAVIKNGQVIDLGSQVAAAMGVDTFAGQPYRSAAPGGIADVGFANIWPGAASIPRPICVYPSLDVVIFWYLNDASKILGLVVHGPTHRVLGYWSVSVTAIGSTTIFGAATSESTGHVYMLQAGAGRVGRLPGAMDLLRLETATADQFGSSTATNPAIRFVAGRMAETPAINCQFDTLRLEVERETTDVSTIGVQHFTSREQTNALLAAAQTFAPTVDTKETHILGLAAYGRWIAPVVTVNHTASTARCPVRFYRLEVDGFVDAPADAVS